VDVSSVSAISLNIPRRSSAGAQDAAQATAPLSGVATSQTPQVANQNTNSSGFTAANSTTPGSGNRDQPALDATPTDKLSQALNQANNAFKLRGQNLFASFEKDKITGINMVKIVDRKTNETISQMPPKEMVAFAQFLEQTHGTRGQLLNAVA
jgi:uncharacterized FlaG/YvyC family protein